MPDGPKYSGDDRRQPSGELIVYRLDELKQIVAAGFERINGRLGKLEEKVTEIEVWKAGVEASIEARHKAYLERQHELRVDREEESSPPIDVTKVVLAALGIAATALGILGATGGTLP